MINENIRVSVIIPVFNNAEFLETCLDRVLGQSMKEIEVICIDDASSDRSAEILRTYAEKDHRIRTVFYETNKSASQGRKDGVLLSRGEYILFADGDDFLEPGACEDLYREMQEDPVDILHFGTNILNWSGVEEARLLAMERLLEPYMGRIEGRSVFESCFREKKYGFSLWNKLFKGDLCRKAMRFIEDGVFPKAQDKYAFFVISYFAGSYRGISRKYYTYRFGSGITGHACLDLDMFGRYCTMGKTADAIERFVKRERAFSYMDIAKDSSKQLLGDVLANWERVRSRERAQAFDMILNDWNACDVVGALAQRYWFNQGFAAQNIKDARSVRRKGKNHGIKTIGTHYMRICGGGAQRVTAMLANIWQEMGYQVILFTDFGESADDYYLDPRIVRIILPARQSMTREEYTERAEILEREIKSRDIDVMVYHPWVSDILLWDMLVCKLSGAYFIVHCHNVFPMLMRNVRIYIARMTRIYELCDAVITLSETDRLFWQNFNPNVYETRNPLYFDSRAVVPSALQSKEIVWIGRFSPEKRPMDALKIIKKVLAAEPEATLYMLGEISAETRKFYEKKIVEMNLENHVKICGYVLELSDYLQKASLQLITSEYEGFSLALLEGMAYGLPCVMYELPYLYLVQNNESIVSVSYQDTSAAADKILELFRNEDKRKKKGRAALDFIGKLSEFGIEEKWKEIFESLDQDHGSVDGQNLLMFHTLFDFYEAGALRAQKCKGNGNQQKTSLSLLTRKTVFWGCGQRAHRLLDKYPKLQIAFCIDNDRNKEGQQVHEVPVVYTEHVRNWENLFIIITVAANRAIVEQLKDMGMQYGEDYILATDLLSLD